jgi:hypothetical protein
MRPFCTIFAYLEVPSAVALLRNFDLEEQAQQLSDKRKYSAVDSAAFGHVKKIAWWCFAQAANIQRSRLVMCMQNDYAL